MRGRDLLRRGASLLIFLLLWQALSLRLSGGLAVASPPEALRALGALLPTPGFWRRVLSSCAHILGGLLAALLAAAPAAALSFHFRSAELLAAPPVAFMKSVPVTVIVILLLILFSSEGIALAVVFPVAFPILYTALLSGVRAADEKLLEMARVFRWSEGRKWRWIRLASARPHLESALRLASGMAWKAGIAAEVIGVSPGSVGEALYSARVFLATDELFAWAAAIMVMGALTERGALLGLRLFFRAVRPTAR